MIIWLTFSLLWVAWLAFMIICPAQWSSIVDKENDFWVRKGVLKASTAEKFARFEKGKGQKILVAIAMLGFLAITWLHKG